MPAVLVTGPTDTQNFPSDSRTHCTDPQRMSRPSGPEWSGKHRNGIPARGGHQCSRICILRFSDLKNMFFRCFEITHQKVVKRKQKFCHQSVKMSWQTSPSDYCNSVSSSWSVRPILSHCWMWMSVEIVASKFPDVMGAYKRLSHTVLSCTVSRVRISEHEVWCLCWWIAGTDFR